MSSINCPECGVEISDQAHACSWCGNPVNAQTEQDKTQCPHCEEMINPKVTVEETGMHSKICPVCSKNIENDMDQEYNLIHYQSSWTLGLFGIGVFVLILFLFWLMM